MQQRAGLLAMLVGVSALTGSGVTATAATRPVCRLVVDARGDAALTEPGPSGPLTLLPGGATDDLVSADVASDGRTVTAVLRMADVQALDPTAPAGHGYELTFRVHGTTLIQFLEVRTYATGTRSRYGYSAHDATGRVTYTYGLGEARGTVDVARREIRVHAPAVGFLPRGTVRRGTTLIGLHASSYRLVGQGAVASQDPGGIRVPLTGTALLFDAADGDRYVVGTPSCVRPGA